MRPWQGMRRLALKTRYTAERVRVRVRDTLRREQRALTLDTVHRRLELVLAAAYGRPIVIAPIKHSGVRGRFRRLLPFAHREDPPTIDGETIQLPAQLWTGGDERRTADRYRLFAIEQAERITRGTLTRAAVRDPLERDLYLLREAAVIDSHIARSYPGMRQALNDERAAALTKRPKDHRFTQSERDVEQLLRTTLTTPAHELDAPSNDPEASLEWARQTASDIRRRGDVYRGVPLAPGWGPMSHATDAGPDLRNSAQSMLPGRQPSRGTRGTPSKDDSSKPDAPDKNSNKDDSRPDEKGRSAETGAPAKPKASVSLDSTSTNSPIDSQAMTESPGYRRDTRIPSTEDLPPAIYYDEWNSDRGSYARSAAAVRLYEPTSANPAWLRDDLQNYASTARQIRQQFERLRARRTLSVRQQRGDALDIAACVEAMTARRMGDTPGERLYVDARPARRGIAISLLIDASGSTDRRVTEARRIIDLEKIALLLATKALDALGDLYAIYAFAGRHASNVKITVVKDFPEANSEMITRRIAAIQPGGFTRLGAAVRHATRELARQAAGHRLLLLLSDGRPNDLDAYQGTYGVEDSRQSILEARASGVFPYCLTIDQSAVEYLPRIFGKAGHTVLQKPEQLPKALLAVVRGLIKK